MKIQFVVLRAVCVGVLALSSLLSPLRASTERGSRVELYDHGLNVPVYTLELPAGWQMRHFIATDLNNVWRMYSHYAVDFFGPEGEFVTHFTPTVVYAATGQHWEAVWLELFDERIGPLGQFRTSDTQRNTSARLFPQAARYGIPVFERAIAGFIGHQQIEGKLYTLLGDLGYAVMLYPHAVLVPKGQWPKTIETLQSIAASQSENPQYAARSRQVMQYRLQQANAAMQANRNWFNAFQTTMRQTAQLRTEHNRGFANYLKSQHSPYGGDDYTPNDMFGDYLRDTTSFDDPYTGFRVEQPGRYEYWYTDSLGQFYGTNNPNFEPESLIGDWSRITPLGP